MQDPGPLRPAEMRAFAAVAATLAATAVVLAMTSPSTAGAGTAQKLAHALVVVVPVAVGLYALQRGAATRFAFLFVAAGFIWAPTLLTLSDQSVPYSIGRVWTWLLEPTLIYLVLCFPSGRLNDRPARMLVVAAVLIASLLYVSTALFVDHYPEPSPWSSCTTDCPPNGLMIAAGQPAFIASVIEPAREVLTVLVYLAVAALLAQRIRRGSRITRWTIVPVLAVALFRALSVGAFLVARRIDSGSDTTELFGLIAVLAIPATAAALLAGLFRWRLQATRALKRLTAEMGAGLTAARARDLIARAIGDPTLEIAYWSGDPGGWVDGKGRAVELPRDAPERAVSEIWAGGHLVAALVTDVTILLEPAVGEVARGFSLMALENRRLDAELGSSLRELRESRARVLAAADKERIRIERDLHDGAQQRLVALRVGLQLAAEAVQDDDRTRASALLERLGTDMDAAVDEVRTLARGMSPPLLADHGLAEALRAAARRSTLSVVMLTRGVGRYPQEVESAVYFCCLEALQNAEKHAQAESCQVRLYEDDELRFEVSDDGVGIDVESAPRGSGLVNMRDRIASVRGSIVVEPIADGGTRVAGRVPVGTLRLSTEVELMLQRATDVLEDCFAVYNAVRGSFGEPSDFVIEHVNEAACRDVGLPRETQLGRTLREIRPRYLGDQLLPWLLEALASEGSRSTENVIYTPGAAGARSVLKVYEVRAAPLRGGRLAVTWRDVTDRKRADRELPPEPAIAVGEFEGVCMVRARDGLVTYANRRFAEILGYTVEELEGLSLAGLGWAWAGSGAEDVERLALARMDDMGEIGFEVRAHRKDGTPISCEGHVSAFSHPEHRRVLVIVQQGATVLSTS